MTIPVFHDRDYRGYFGILDRLSGRALFASDRDVGRCNGSISSALATYGTPTWIDRTNPYYRLRLSLS